jgi:hypothetical protein
MSLLYEREVLDPKEFYLRDPAAEMVSWQGREALRFSGQGACLALLPDLSLTQGRVEVDIAAEGTAYPGIVFHASDTYNYELAYAQPHTSGKWDALQYDPVFHGSNTWQLYHGPGTQQVAQVPVNDWFRLSVEFRGQQAIVRVGDQTPLFVHRLAHGVPTGRVGLWTFLPAYFANLCLWDDLPDFARYSFPSAPTLPVHTPLMEWFLEGYGAVTCEPSGILNLNRYLPVSVREVHLVREIEITEAGDFTFRIGFSDVLSLQVDEQVIFTGENLFHSSPNWIERGYVSLEGQQVSLALSQGRHRITANLQATEYFGFGLALKIEGGEYRLPPVQLFE